MSILSFISDIFKPAADLIDDCVTSDEERMKLRNELAKMQSDIQHKMLDLEKAALEASSKVAVAEAKSDSWFTRTYRPAIITAMFVMFCLNAFGLLTVELPDIFIQVFGVAFGVTSAGRSIEKFKSLTK